MKTTDGKPSAEVLANEEAYQREQEEYIRRAPEMARDAALARRPRTTVVRGGERAVVATDTVLTITVSGEPGVGAAPLAQFIAELLRERGVPITPTRTRDVFRVDVLDVHKLLSENFQKHS